MKDHTQTSNGIVHISFEVGLYIKGIHGLLEMIGGVFLALFDPNKLNLFIRFLTQHELSEDPQDKIANFLITLSSHLSISTQQFASFYLISHGIIKCILILLLWRKKLWAYPLTIIAFMLFIAYQIYRYTLTHSVFLIWLTIFDIVMIVLTYLEYQKIKSVQKHNQSH